MTWKKLLAAAGLMALVSPGLTHAHHSFAVFFDSEKLVRIKGEIKVFRFANPHGTIVVGVPTRSGEQRDWQIETNSPSVLTRRGWSRESLRPGQDVTIEGWLARDGSRYMRLRQAYGSDGEPVGSRAFTVTED